MGGFNNPTGPFGGLMNMVQNFQQFRNSFHGDPKQQVEQLLNSGKITKEQYDAAVNMANQIMHMFN